MIGDKRTADRTTSPVAQTGWALATHYEFIYDRHIGTFTMFLDDFYFGEHKVNAGFIQSSMAGERPSKLTSEQQAAIDGGCLGLIQFTETPGDFFFKRQFRNVPTSVSPTVGVAATIVLIFTLTHYTQC